MVEIDGTHLFILDTLHNTLEYWDKTVAPTSGEISTTIDLTDLIAGTPDCRKAEFDDIDECMTGTETCDANATCTNRSGVASCLCNPGYTGPGETCMEMQTCANGG
ncbi:MAG: hypothetical protein IIA03_05930, partial [Proteobacteria bacterium]|nr:hypothetical protein [Pseudomonadota bacterium]